MSVVNIYSDELPKLKNYDMNISEYKILMNELDSACNIIEEIKRILQERENNGLILRTQSNSEIENNENKTYNREVSYNCRNVESPPPEESLSSPESSILSSEQEEPLKSTTSEVPSSLPQSASRNHSTSEIPTSLSQSASRNHSTSDVYTSIPRSTPRTQSASVVPTSMPRSIPCTPSGNIKTTKTRSITKKTIPPQLVLKYIARMNSGEEQNPPQIILIDIREPKDYHSGHIYWKNNSNLYFNGVINIPLKTFYSSNTNMKKLISEAESLEIEMKKKALIRSICKADLIIYYDFSSDVTNNELHQIIPDTLFNSNNDKRIKRPPVMLEYGYNGWVQYINSLGKNISDWVEVDHK
jgi:rhodanese-related sulfurtransferase